MPIMTEQHAYRTLDRIALARLLRDCRARYGICRGAAGRFVCRAMKRQCGIA